MSNNSKIEWTDASWQPVVGCSKVSPGCLNCYAERMARRQAYMKNEYYEAVVKGVVQTSTEKLTYTGWNGKTSCIESKLTEPLHWRKPRKIFVCSMGDLFHESVPFEFIDKVMAVMALCPQHTFQILTKRSERMKEYFDMAYCTEYGTEHIGEAIEEITQAPDPLDWEAPLPNVWLGVTAENQEQVDKRIPLLLQTPAVKRFASIEPMLGAIDLEYIKDFQQSTRFWKYERIRSLTGERLNPAGRMSSEKLDLIICGGETGPGARPMDLAWARSLRDQCKAANVPFFFKNVGGVRKPENGHLLDGREHRSEF